MTGKDPETSLESLLITYRDELVRFLEREGSGLRRFETAEDLAQAVQLRALRENDEFTYLGERPFRAWLFTLARRHVADRADHWSAMKRGGGRALRLTFSGSGSGTGVPASVLSASQTGPGTFASRRELLILATRALAALPERDRQLVSWSSEGVSLEEQARRLGIGYAAVQRAGLRAQDRFRKTFELIQKRLS